MNKLKVALAGNPNSGKTSLFNLLTGSNQHVGNWPGVTVEKKEGTLKTKTKKISIIDLPGIYGLGAYSEDEIVARNYIVHEKPDLIVNIIDATNIDRGMYLTLQLLEVTKNVVVVLNIIDEARKKNIIINKEELEKKLGVKVLETSALKKEGIEELIGTIENYKGKDNALNIEYGKTIENAISEVQEIINENTNIDYDKRFLAIKALENDENIIEFIEKESKNSDIIKSSIENIQNKVENELDNDPESEIVDARYKIIESILKSCVDKSKTKSQSISDKIDKIVTNKYLGIPIFALIMFVMYQVTIKIGNEFLGGYVDEGIGAFGDWVGNQMANAPELLRSFVVDGVIAGVGAVLVFVPLIFTLYLFISILEDSGYMARAAYVMDKFMTSIGLHGKTAISLIIGSGCNVAGIMATRTLESKKDRMISILINPFISCTARLPIYVLFVSAFFKDQKLGFLSMSGIIIFLLYGLGIVVAIVMAKIFSKTLFKGESSYFIMELPPYRIPSIKSVLIHMWEKSEGFLKKAGTIILGITVIVWVLCTLPMGVEPGSAESLLGKIGGFIAPIFEPAGFGNWQAGAAIITGLGAKEAMVSTMGTIFGVAEGSPEILTAIQSLFTPLSAISFMVFSLLYCPCAATIGAIKRETNSRKWAWFAVVYTCVVAWIVSVIVYQVGRMLGF